VAKALLRLTGAGVNSHPGATHVDCECWLARFSSRPCDRPMGLLWRVHLLDKQQLARRGADPWDPRGYVWACGGASGLAGCHGLLDSYRLVVPRVELPAEVLELAAEAGMLAWVDRRYGELAA
jgi:hypothetical protein